MNSIKTIPNKWSEIEIQTLRSMFPNEPKDRILKCINRNWTAIRTKAVTLGIRRESRYRMVSGVEHYFFDTWSNKMAYILGFIAADGNISKNMYKMGIKLAIKDRALLESIRDIVAPKNKLYLTKDHKYIMLEVCSKYLCKSIVSHGIVPKKSSVLDFPTIPPKYVRHFVRGYFDGDGCISKHTKTGVWKSYFLGTHDFLKSINAFLSDNGIIGSKNIIYVRQSNIFKLAYSTYDSIRLGQWMYHNSDICLERKYKKFNQLVKERAR